MTDQDLSGLKIDKTAAAFRPVRRKKKVVWLVALSFVILAGVLFAAGILTPAVEVEVATISQVYPSQSFTLLNASGYVVAQRKAAVASKATGRLEWLGVEEGSRVRSGEVLARLENRDAAASRDQSAANLNTARASLDQALTELLDAGRAFTRQKELLAQGIVAQADYDAAEARYNKAKAGVAGAEAAVKAADAALNGAAVALEYTLIRAPFDAVVLTRDADVGDIVTPLGAAANAKAAVVTIADMGSLQVEADVSESNLEKIRTGQPCEVQLDALPGARFAGAVHIIVPTADRSKATVMVKVRFLTLDSRILPEMSAKVAFLERPVKKEESEPRTAVNPAAIVTRDGRKTVFLVKGTRVAATEIRTGAQIGEMIEVLAGVKAGDKVAVKPLDKLKDGSKIKTAEK
ncbi:MAG TPA: efflux RND transporter periplasmic adaptor subunit [Geobacteraceae bacterium]|nr:efflux RND transporter periplasmic adaptor subunit [Geobacteraceae bacterium]